MNNIHSHSDDNSPGIYGISLALLVNRFQMLYFIIILPHSLIYPHMIWAILLMGGFSQLNIWIIGKWYDSMKAKKGNRTVSTLSGSISSRFAAFCALIIILLKITVNFLCYIELIHQFIFPSADMLWLIVAFSLLIFYLASQGFIKVVQFVVPIYICSFWWIFIIGYFIFSPEIHISNLFPLVPESIRQVSMQGILRIWASFSGPEFCMFLIPLVKEKQNVYKWLSIGNALSILEYLIVFIATLMFFGSSFLNKIHYPVINMTRYLKFPFLERFDIIMISINMFHFVLVMALLLLLFHRLLQAIFYTRSKPEFKPFISFIIVLVVLIGVNNLLWNTDHEMETWINLQSWIGAAAFALVPILLVAVLKIKGGFHKS